MQRRRSTLILAISLILVIVFPGIGEVIRGAVASIFGETGERIITILAGLATILALLFGSEIRQWVRGSPDGTLTAQSAKPPVQPERTQQVPSVGPSTGSSSDPRMRIRDKA